MRGIPPTSFHAELTPVLMRQMSGCVSLNLLLGGGSWSAHHPRPKGILPSRGFYHDHLLLRLAMMAQVVITLANSLLTLLKDRWEFVCRVEVISFWAITRILPTPQTLFRESQEVLYEKVRGSDPL